MSHDIIYLQHILECIERIRNRVLLRGEEEFFQDQDTTDIALRNLQIMAGSTQRVTKEAKSLAPEIPWQDISDFRNILVHDYLGDIDYKLTWNVIANELPILKEAVEIMLKSLKEQQ